MLCCFQITKWKKNKTDKKNINKTQCKLLLNEIKSKYIITKIFDNLKTRKFLQIIEYNKKISKRIDISLKDCLKKFWIDNQIEIELNIFENPKYDEDKKNFINFEKEEEPYIHIYLNKGGYFTCRGVNDTHCLKMIKVLNYVLIRIR